MGEISLAKYIKLAAMAPIDEPSGIVSDVVGLIAEVSGLRAGVGELLRLQSAEAAVDLEVIGFKAGRLLATPLGPIAGVRAGSRVSLMTRGGEVPVSDSLLGRLIDPFGIPLDDGPILLPQAHRPVRAAPPRAVSRRPVEKVFGTGVRAIDAFLTLGSGQRMGIFAGAGVGKTTLLSMLCRASEADVNVIGLVGERGREVNDFVRGALGPVGLAKSVVVVATSDQPPLVRARGAETATAVAEYFRDQGKKVLLVIDSVTRYAMALREAALATGEPPATKGYPPSVFAALPRLLERAGTCGGEGSITALYTVLVEGDDLSDPIADSVRSILDGHIVLSRTLAERNHFPAIDVLQSISRLAPTLMTEIHQRDSSSLRDLLSAHREAADLIQIGAYVPGSDPRVDAATRILPHVESFLKQGMTEPSTWAAATDGLHALSVLASNGRPRA